MQIIYLVHGVNRVQFMITYTNRGKAVNHPHELPPQRYIDAEAEVQLHQYTLSCDPTFFQLKEYGMNGDQCTHTIK